MARLREAELATAEAVATIPFLTDFPKLNAWFPNRWVARSWSGRSLHRHLASVGERKRRTVVGLRSEGKSGRIHGLNGLALSGPLRLARCVPQGSGGYLYHFQYGFLPKGAFVARRIARQ